MNKGLLLIVDDDPDIHNMLRIYFDSLGYESITAVRGEEALEMCNRWMPSLVILDIMLPDINGYEVCRRIKSDLRTGHIPVMFLTQKDEQEEQIHGLKCGADDYITKPVDLHLLSLRVQNALQRAALRSQTSEVTGLPSAKLIEEQLTRLLSMQDWALLYAGINHFRDFNDTHGSAAGDKVLRFTATLMTKVVDELGIGNEFIGHTGGDNFFIISTPEAAPQIKDRLIQRFDAEIVTFYGDEERGEAIDHEGQAQKTPLMTLVIGMIQGDTMPYTDIREITEIAAEARRKAKFEG
jgi:diguanylate cyclase (GGDEF)-like protein